MSSSDNNRRIAKNTAFLYIRMLLVMGVTLFTSRIILDALGEINYGIYNVVGGVVAMFSFFCSTSASTCQRYFSYEIGRNNRKGLADIFKLNMSVFLMLAFIVLVFAETVGLWFVNNRLTIPEERMFATNIVYQSTILSFFFTIVSVPYNALIIAHERMAQFAYFSIIEVLLKLLLAITLLHLENDKLITYAVMMLFCQAMMTFCYYYYCHRYFEESQYRFYWNKDKFKEVLAYSGWHQLGALSVIARNQGVSILVNMFFNPVVNAGRAISLQVTAATDSLSNNFFVAAKPQIYKYYAQGEVENLHRLIFRSTKVCFFLIIVIAIPLIVNCNYVLSLWLKDVPAYAVLFTQLSLVNAIIDSTNGPAIAAALATANIKKFEIITASLMILNLPISYIVLQMGGRPEYVVIVSILLSSVTVIVRAFILRNLIGISVYKYLVNTCFPLLLVTFISGVSYYYLYTFLPVDFINLIVSSLANLLFCSVLCYCLATNPMEKKAIKGMIRSKIYKKR